MAGGGRRSARGNGRVDAVLLAAALTLSVFALALPEARSDRIASTLRSTILAPLVSLQQRAERARGALAAHDSVTLATDSVALRALDAGRLADENARLRRVLGLAARLKLGFVAAEVMHGPSRGEEHTIVLSAGTNAGIAEFSAVVAPEGIVGYVRSAGPSSSVAIVWAHPDFRVSGMGAVGSASGIVSAHMGEGAGRYLLELRGVPFRTPLEPGALIVSSGLGGTFPRGIPIGRVIGQLPTEEGWERNYLLMPAVNAADVGAVLVFVAGRPDTDLRNVWVLADSAGPAARRAAAAGDSLARIGAARDTGGRRP